MIDKIWSIITNNAIARWLVAIGAAVVSIGAILLKVFYSGKSAAQDAQRQETIKNIGEKNEITDAVARMPSTAQRDELRKWSK